MQILFSCLHRSFIFGPWVHGRGGEGAIKTWEACTEMQGSETLRTINPSANHVVNGLAVTEEQRPCRPNLCWQSCWPALQRSIRYHSSLSFLPYSCSEGAAASMLFASCGSLETFGSLSQPMQHIHHCLKEFVAFSRPWYVFSLRGKQLKYKPYWSTKVYITEVTKIILCLTYDSLCSCRLPAFHCRLGGEKSNYLTVKMVHWRKSVFHDDLSVS